MADGVRRRLKRIGRGTCFTCRGGFEATALVIDHRLPLRDGGRDELANLQTLCTTCHKAKTAHEAGRRADG